MEVEYTAILRTVEMLLDQLYYWARRAADTRNDQAGADVARQMLDRATEGLERFVTTLLDCFRPIELARAPTSTAHVVAALAARAREDYPASIVVSAGADETIVADSAQLARVWPAVFRRLGSMAGAALEVTAVAATRDGQRGVVITVHQRGTGGANAATDPMAELDWVLAQRIVTLHAGMVDEQVRPRERTVVIFLPVR